MLTKRGAPIQTYAFLVAVEIEEEGPSFQEIENKLVDSLRFVEGTGRVDVDGLGRLEEEESDYNPIND